MKFRIFVHALFVLSGVGYVVAGISWDFPPITATLSICLGVVILATGIADFVELANEEPS